MNPIMWHAKIKSVLNFQAPQMSCCRGNCEENLLHSTDRHADKEEVDTGFIQKLLSPYGMPKERV
jgi:hypothetical protein